MNNTYLVCMMITGVVLVLSGLFVQTYSVKVSVLYKKRRISISPRNLADSRLFQRFSDFITADSTNGMYHALNKLLKKAEADINVRTLLLYKLISVTVAAVFLLLIRYTNIDVTKVYIISNAENDINLFGNSALTNYEYNLNLYKAVIGRVGEKNLKKLNDDKKFEAVRLIISEQMIGQGEEAEERARIIVRTFNRVESIKLIDWKTVLLIIISYFIPDIILYLRKVVLSSKYKREVVKLENIFELLGSIRGFKTIFILKEMSKASTTCNSQLTLCVTSFQSDREQALETMRKSIPNRKFSKLVDIIRVYSMVDKKLAMEILERNRQEKEEEMLLTAEEDIDIIDVVAFASVIPIIYELGNLMMKPMMDIIFQSFSVI